MLNPNQHMMPALRTVSNSQFRLLYMYSFTEGMCVPIGLSHVSGMHCEEDDTKTLGTEDGDYTVKPAQCIISFVRDDIPCLEVFTAPIYTPSALSL